MTADLHSVAAEALEAVAAAGDLGALDAVRARYLGRGDGELTAFRRGLGTIADPDGRRQMGQMVNELVERVTGAADDRQRDIERAARAQSLETEALDLTRPAPPLRRGRLNPVTLASIEIRRIFAQLGYAAVEGPEVISAFPVAAGKVGEINVFSSTPLSSDQSVHLITAAYPRMRQ